MATDSEGSLLSSNGVLRHFGRRAFVNLADDIGRCFICGTSRADSMFNDEHVIPDWLLRRYKLHSRRVTLPNGRQLIYGRYTLRCCQKCNLLLGQCVEAPVSQLFVEDVYSTMSNLQNDPTLLHQWLCLLFIKLHLKDREIRVDPDVRNESCKIGELYDWDGLHHIHSVARAAHSRATIEDSVLGTTFMFEMKSDQDAFDFGTLSGYSTILVKIGSIGVVSVLNDCGCVRPMVSKYFSNISGPLSLIQLREVSARLAYGNKLLTNRPVFWSALEREEYLTICSKPSALGEIGKVDKEELGQLIAHSCGPLLLKSRSPNLEEKIRQLQRGDIRFLFHDDGVFIQD